MLLDNRGRWEEAEAALGQSLEIYRNYGDSETVESWWATKETSEHFMVTISSPSSREGETQVLNLLGLAHLVQRRWDKAEDAYRQALAVCREVGDHEGESEAILNLGGVYVEQDRWSEAEEAYRQSLAVEHADAELKEAAHRGLGLACLNQERWQEAEEILQQSIAMARESGDHLSELENLYYLGKAHEGLGHLGEAEDAYRQCLSLARDRRTRQRRAGLGETRRTPSDPGGSEGSDPFHSAHAAIPVVVVSACLSR